MKKLNVENPFFEFMGRIGDVMAVECAVSRVFHPGCDNWSVLYGHVSDAS